jgi:hypothetical protein
MAARDRPCHDEEAEDRGREVGVIPALRAWSAVPLRPAVAIRPLWSGSHGGSGSSTVGTGTGAGRWSGQNEPAGPCGVGFVGSLLVIVIVWASAGICGALVVLLFGGAIMLPVHSLSRRSGASEEGATVGSPSRGEEATEHGNCSTSVADRERGEQKALHHPAGLGNET